MYRVPQGFWRHEGGGPVEVVQEIRFGVLRVLWLVHVLFRRRVGSVFSGRCLAGTEVSNCWPSTITIIRAEGGGLDPQPASRPVPEGLKLGRHLGASPSGMKVGTAATTTAPTVVGQVLGLSGRALGLHSDRPVRGLISSLTTFSRVGSGRLCGRFDSERPFDAVEQFGGHLLFSLGEQEVHVALFRASRSRRWWWIGVPLSRLRRWSPCGSVATGALLPRPGDSLRALRLLCRARHDPRVLGESSEEHHHSRSLASRRVAAELALQSFGVNLGRVDVLEHVGVCGTDYLGKALAEPRHPWRPEQAR